MIRRSLFAVAALAAAACLPPAPAVPAPTTLTTSKSPIEVVQSAARALTAQGFDIVTSDATGGILVAKRMRERKGNYDVLACRARSGSLDETALHATLTVNLAATPTPAGTSVVIRGSALAQYPQLTGMLAQADSDTDCASNGTIEKALADVIGVTTSAR